MFFERARSTRKMKSLYVLLQLREEFNQIERNDFSVQVISLLKMTAGHECNKTKKNALTYVRNLTLRSSGCRVFDSQGQDMSE